MIAQVSNCRVRSSHLAETDIGSLGKEAERVCMCVCEQLPMCFHLYHTNTELNICDFGFGTSYCCFD